MKYLITILFHILIFLSLNGQGVSVVNWQSYDPDDITDFEYKINGPVRTIHETSYIIDDNQKILKKGWEYSWSSPSRMYFDKAGNIIKVDNLHDDGTVSRSDAYAYQDGRLVLGRINFSTDLYIYDDAGRLTEEYREVTQPRVNPASVIQPTPTAYASKLTYTYYANGTVSGITEMSLDGTIVGKAVCHYIDGSTELDKIVFDYDDVVETFDYTLTNSLITQIKRSDSEEGLFESYDYVYQDDQIVEETWKLYDGGTFDGQVRYRFENYNEVEVQESEGDGTIDYTMTYTYEFDDRGNWLRKYFTKKGKDYMVKREIVYWE